MVDLTEIEEYLDVERYGLGVPFGSFSLALGLSMFTAPGLTEYHALTVYGQIGVVFLSTIIVGLFVAAGYTFRLVDTDRFVRRKEDIRQEHQSEQSDDEEDETA